MLNLFGDYPRFVAIEDDYDDFYSNILDVVTGYPFGAGWGLMQPYRRSNRRRNDTKYVISIDVGKHYELKDITTTIENRNLKVNGHAVESLKNGNNTHNFSREYVIPEEVVLESKQIVLNNGILRISFDKKHVEPKKELEDLSKDNEFRVKVNFPGFKPDEISVKVVNNDLVVEGTRKSNNVTEDGQTRSSFSGYVSRTIRLDHSVESDKLRAVASQDGGIEVFAPRDPTRIAPAERTLKIEK